MSHSKGPWEVAHDGPSRPIIITADHVMLSVSRLDVGGWTTYEAEEADACLIASAPDLLSALKVVMQYYDNGSSDWDAVRDVIAKAEGRA